MPNFVKIGQTVAKIWIFFLLFKMAAVGHLVFANSKNFNGRSGEVSDASTRKILVEIGKRLWR